MIRKGFLLLGVLFTVSLSFSQNSPAKIISSDIDLFWRAYDSIRSTGDSLRQLHLIQTMYLDKGSAGVKGFIKAKGYTAEKYVKCIRSYPKFWHSIRPNTYKVTSLTGQFEPAIKKLKALYPALRPATIYFAIGAMQSGGTTKDSMVLIGAELATGDEHTDISELPPATQNWLSITFKKRPLDHIVLTNTHEYVHTQEKEPGDNLLAQCIYEGVCDFVAEQATGKLPDLPVYTYGPAHADSLKAQFKVEMFGRMWRRWLYNFPRNGMPGDLGYYMGYSICRAYYQQARDKKQAIKEMIETDFADSTAVEAFLEKSAYYGGPVNKQALLKVYNERRPYVTKITPFANGDMTVDTSVKKLRVEFSAPMSANGVSVELGPGGRDQNPIVGREGFSADRKSIAFLIALKPGHRYGFILSDGSFRSEDDYPLAPFEVAFKTKE